MSLHCCSRISLALWDRSLLIWQVQKNVNRIVGSVAEWLKNSPIHGERNPIHGERPIHGFKNLLALFCCVLGNLRHFLLFDDLCKHL